MSEVNKSESVRQYLSAHPEASTSDVVKALASNGVEVAPSQVSSVKKSLGLSSPRGERKPKAVASSSAPSNLPAAAAFAKSAGSIEAAQEHINAVAEYLKAFGLDVSPAVTALEQLAGLQIA